MPTIPIHSGLPMTTAPSAPTSSLDRLRAGAFVAPTKGLFAMSHSGSLPATGVPATVAPAPPRPSLMPRSTPSASVPTAGAPAAALPVVRHAPTSSQPAPAAASYQRPLLGA